MKKIRITKQHIKDFNKAIRAWKDNGSFKNDKGMLACYKKDRADMRKIVTMLKKGQFSEAGEAMWGLDTIVRDQIPNSVYDLVVN